MRPEATTLPYATRSPVLELLTRPSVRLTLLTTLCALSIHFTKLAPAAAFLIWIVALSLPATPTSNRATRRGRWAVLSLCSVLAAVGFMRFVLNEAIPGVIAGGQAAATKHAMAFLRGVVVAQDFARKNALLDTDRDGIGSALELTALAGLTPLRDGRSLAATPLSVPASKLRQSPLGTLVEDSGYLFHVCLPAVGGGWVDALRGDAVDDEAAERSYLVYAWPVSDSPGSPRQSIYADALERILVHGPAEDDAPSYAGTLRPPACDAAERDLGWSPWKDKQPRQALPGDTR
jgi:hypothetical protein